MTFRTATDFRKSLETRLKNFAHETSQDLQRIRRKVAFERLLARIFHQKSKNFILKGGYAMELRFSTARATKDIDLTCLHRIRETNLSMEQMILRELQKILRTDLHDYFVFEIGPAQLDLDNAPYGGARYSVSSFVDSRLFVKFQLDVGGDVIVDKTEEVEGSDWLSFCGVYNPTMHMISAEQQLAEKIHAYTLPRDAKVNSRAKDIIDILLLSKLRPINLKTLQSVTKTVFDTRGTHSLPETLAPPPKEWETLYLSLANECGLSHTLDEAYSEFNKFFEAMIDIT